MANPLGRLLDKFLDPGRKMRASQFELLKVCRGDIIFLGDSITEGGLWHEWFPGVALKNRGIGGDTTRGVLDRMDTAIGPAPAAVFLLIGTNDLSIGLTRDQIAGNVRRILAQMRNDRPETPVFLQSVMPRSKKYSRRIQALNELYSTLADEYGATWVDLWPVLANGDGGLKNSYTLDKLHLTGEAYSAWISVLRPLVEQARTTPQEKRAPSLRQPAQNHGISPA